MRRTGEGVNPLTLKELAAILRSGDVQDGPIADFEADYAEASKVLRKKDD